MFSWLLQETSEAAAAFFLLLPVQTQTDLRPARTRRSAGTKRPHEFEDLSEKLAAPGSRPAFRLSSDPCY